MNYTRPGAKSINRSKSKGITTVGTQVLDDVSVARLTCIIVVILWITHEFLKLIESLMT